MEGRLGLNLVRVTVDDDPDEENPEVKFTRSNMSMRF
jgi:hypothetical protein